MVDVAIREPPKGLRIGPVLIRVEVYPGAGGQLAGQELLHALAGGLGIGTAVQSLEAEALAPLEGGHRTAAPQLGVLETVEEVGLPDQQVDVEGPVLTELEGAQAVEDQPLLGNRRGTQKLVEEQAVAS
jgi:hypothetical protein